MCLSREDDPKRKNVLKNHMNNFHVHQKFIWSLEGHHPFQNIIGHLDWNPNFGSTSQGPNSFIFYDFEVRQSALESLRCIIQMLCWTKFHNPKINTCDNTKHYRSLWTKTIECEKSPTSSAHNFLIKNPNDARFKSKLIFLKICTTFMLKVLSFEACIIETEGLEVGPFFGKIFKYMFCTLNFMASFQYFTNSKFIFVQHNICSSYQDLSNHYPHDHVSFWQSEFSKRRRFVFIYA